MSRSLKKNPFTGWSCKASDKKDKQLANRRFRRKVNLMLGIGNIEDEVFPDILEISDKSQFAKDGKQYFDDEQTYRK